MLNYNACRKHYGKSGRERVFLEKTSCTHNSLGKMQRVPPCKVLSLDQDQGNYGLIQSKAGSG